MRHFLRRLRRLIPVRLDFTVKLEPLETEEVTFAGGHMIGELTPLVAQLIRDERNSAAKALDAAHEELRKSNSALETERAQTSILAAENERLRGRIDVLARDYEQVASGAAEQIQAAKAEIEATQAARDALQAFIDMTLAANRTDEALIALANMRPVGSA
jgi:hypothetical protein